MTNNVSPTSAKSRILDRAFTITNFNYSPNIPEYYTTYSPYYGSNPQYQNNFVETDMLPNNYDNNNNTISFNLYSPIFDNHPNFRNISSISANQNSDGSILITITFDNQNQQQTYFRPNNNFIYNNYYHGLRQFPPNPIYKDVPNNIYLKNPSHCRL